MRRERIIFIGLCLVVSLGLIFVHLGICQQTKPGESAGTTLSTEQAAPPAVGETPKPAVSPEGKASAPAKAPKPPKAASKPSAPSTASPVPERTADPGKLPGKFVPSEGC